MPKIEYWFKQDLKKPVRVNDLNGVVFTLDNVGSRIGVEVFDDGEPVTLTGTVNGYVIIPGETTVSVAGTRSNNTAYIELPQSALATPGFIKIAIKLTNSSEITTLLAVVATVYKSRTDTIITPSQQIITDWSQQIAAEMQAVEDASAAQDAKIDDLKSAMDGVLSGGYGELNIGTPTSGNYIKRADGTVSSSSSAWKYTDYIPVKKGSIVFTCPKTTNSTQLSNVASVAFYADSNSSASSFKSAQPLQSGTIGTLGLMGVEIPSDANFCRFSIYGTSASSFKAFNLSNNDTELDDLKTLLNMILMTKGKYIDLSGSSVTMSGGVPQFTGSASSGYAVGMMQCSAGDAFTINGHGGSATRLWGFVNSSGTILSVSPASRTENGATVIAPTGAAWIIVHTDDGRTSFKGYDYQKEWKYNTIDVLSYLPKKSETKYGVTYTWTGDACVVDGEATGASWNNLQEYNGTNIPLIVAGEKYYVKFKQGANGNVALGFAWHLSDSSVTYDLCYFDTEITAPSNYTSVTIGLVVRKGMEADNETIEVNLFNLTGGAGIAEERINGIEASIADLLPRNILQEFGSFENTTSRQVTYTWQPDKKTCVVNGTASGGTSYDFLWMYTDGLPASIIPGNQYKLIYNTSVESVVGVHIYYQANDDEETVTDVRYFNNAIITVPTNCKGISIRLDVDNGTVCDNVVVSVELMTIVGSEQGGVSNKQSKLLSIGSSFMTGIIYPTGTNMVFCDYDSTPYGNVAIGLGIEQKNVQHILMSSTGILAVNPSHPERGNILDKLTSMDLSPYDYILTEINRPDLGTSTDGFLLGDLTSTAGDGTIVGAILELLSYMKTNNPAATLILVGAPPSAIQDAQAYENVFTYVYRDGSSIGDCDLMMHRLAVREHFIFIDWEDLNLSYYYKDFCYPGNVHCMTEPPVRMMGQYLARNCNYGTSRAKVLYADGNG